MAGAGQAESVPARGRRDGRTAITTCRRCFSSSTGATGSASRSRADGRIERIERHWPRSPPEQDLAVRAARALQRHTGVALGADLQVMKHIPVGGGLGGGSSDAATVLLALNRLWETGLGLDELAELGLALGADVPVFVHGDTAWGEGRGERLTARRAAASAGFW